MATYTIFLREINNCPSKAYMLYAFSGNFHELIILILIMEVKWKASLGNYSTAVYDICVNNPCIHPVQQLNFISHFLCSEV